MPIDTNEFEQKMLAAADENIPRTLPELKKPGRIPTWAGSRTCASLVEGGQLVKIPSGLLGNKRLSYCRVAPEAVGRLDELGAEHAERLLAHCSEDFERLETILQRCDLPAWVVPGVAKLLNDNYRWLCRGVGEVRRLRDGECFPVDIPDMVGLLTRENDAGYDAVEQVHSLDLQERENEGYAILDMEVVEVDSARRCARLVAARNLSKFKVGDYLRCHKPDGPSGVVRLIGERQGSLVVGPDFGRRRLPAWLEGNGWILDPCHVDLSERLVYGVKDTDPERRRDLLAWINGRARTMERASLPLELAQGLNDVQQDALAVALGSTEPTLIQGPPGTGKTWLLARLARHLVAMDQVVLVTAFTHRGVHNALEKILAACPDAPIIKFGSPVVATSLPDEIERISSGRAGLRTLRERRAKGPFIVGMTTHAATISLKLNKDQTSPLDIDWVLMDEASQASLPLGLAAVSRGRRAVLFGDHRQMAPVLIAEHPLPGIERSIFEALWQASPGVMLDVTYRMNAELVVAPSKAYYSGELHPASEAAARSYPYLSALHNKLGVDGSNLIIQHQVEVREGLRCAEEADGIASLGALLVAEGLPQTELAVVTPFRVQVRAIRQALDDRGLDCVVVDSVERLQGQEREAIIVSLAIGPRHASAPSISGLRLNVSLTRARSFRAVFGHASWFEAHQERSHAALEVLGETAERLQLDRTYI
jgi:DNA replication ATP-dependent helicase Dna2